MLVATSVATDTRVLREAQALTDGGRKLTILGRNVPPDYLPPHGITVLSASSGQGLRPATMSSLTKKRLPPLMRVLRWLLLPQHRARSFQAWTDDAYKIASTLEFDAIHAHDYTALGLGARLALERDVPFVYDSHEWWSGRQRQHRPTPWVNFREARLEAKLSARAVAVITVGESIAQLMRKNRGLKNVFVVRNSFPNVGDTSAKVVSPPQGIIYAGRIDAYRELEVIIKVAGRVDLPICWMGEHENQWAVNFVPIARAANIEVLNPQPISAVTAAMQNAGLVFVTHSNQFESHRLAMPNKLFHAVHAGVPIIATDVTELGQIVRHYDIGELYKPGDIDSMVAAIHRAIARHSSLITNVQAAKSELSWERDSQVLADIYSDVFSVKR